MNVNLEKLVIEVTGWDKRKFLKSVQQGCQVELVDYRFIESAAFVSEVHKCFIVSLSLHSI